MAPRKDVYVIGGKWFLVRRYRPNCRFWIATWHGQTMATGNSRRDVVRQLWRQFYLED